MSSRNTARGTKDILLIDITDGSEKVIVTVWDPLATILNEELNKNSDQGNIIMIITSCKITELLNAVAESSVSCETISATECSVKKIDVYKLEDIIKLRNTELEKLEVICHVKVNNVDVNSKWWFKVPVHISDGSETIQVFLLDREVRRLISRSVDSFFGHDDKELQYPTPLKDFEGKSLTLTVCLNKENLISGSTIYHASDVIEGIETSASSSVLDKTEQNYTLESISGKYDESDPSKSTPQSKLSVNKRIRPTDHGADDKNKKKSV
ncbi:hypothetical protein POM88_044465 [Heracleum sosnowskyi]|uniref:Replication protein A OB domain-containing protein n=1 Tax=Heracleum sosnowskyi TaxID=360622 RepID=A0AAD8H431_9APIA|nr:hypothetical protein POM88_044465 [Heracleum sosnowskyi]